MFLWKEESCICQLLLLLEMDKNPNSSSIRKENLLSLQCLILFLHHAHLQTHTEDAAGIYHDCITCQLPDSVMSFSVLIWEFVCA